MNRMQAVSQSQAQAPGKRKEKEKTPAKRPSRSGRRWEDTAILRSLGTTQGDQKDNRSSPGGQGRGSSLQEYTASVSSRRGLDYLKIKGGDDLELVWGGGIIQTSAPSSVPHPAAVPSRGGSTGHSWNLCTSAGVRLQCCDPNSCFKVWNLNFSELGHVFRFLKQINACYKKYFKTTLLFSL